jgi:hypothetical protein
MPSQTQDRHLASHCSMLKQSMFVRTLRFGPGLTCNSQSLPCPLTHCLTRGTRSAFPYLTNQWGESSILANDNYLGVGLHSESCCSYGVCMGMGKWYASLLFPRRALRVKHTLLPISRLKAPSQRISGVNLTQNPHLLTQLACIVCRAGHAGLQASWPVTAVTAVTPVLLSGRSQQLDGLCQSTSVPCSSAWTSR